MLNDLSDAVLDCAVDIKVIRHSATPLVKGRKQELLSTEHETRASVQPVSGEDLQRLPQGQRVEETVVVFTPFALQTVHTSVCRTPDRIVACGQTYQVATVEDWFELGGYYKAMAVRVTP